MTATNLPDEQPHKEPSDAEEVYFCGSPPARGLGGQFLLWCLAGLAVLVAPLVLYKGAGIQLPMLGWLICVVVGLDIPVWPILMSKTKKYRITNYRIDYERGIFSKDIDTLELWHVEDIHFHQSLLDRILGVGTIHVVSQDESMPSLMIRGIPHPRKLYETLKQRIIAVKRSRGVIKVDPG
jgi:hypothetical protein